MEHNDRSTWAEVMAEFLNVSLEEWLSVRSAAARLIEADLHDAGVYDSGISSSDVNHTVYGYARPLYLDGLRGHDLATLTARQMNELAS